ncbi:hypothetical protein PR202_gb24153 [Eleusine coracana subsp. coracana]|uniref:Uncharacterized protein n=1 Tax=Eleusine coracana subsp. coracana TaxID=191504 RepID=A0AAV5FL90_ELECO|nr:hypothetical protein PR202_gb24153 [Eleusine coracana subsp. coracana]
MGPMLCAPPATCRKRREKEARRKRKGRLVAVASVGKRCSSPSLLPPSDPPRNDLASVRTTTVATSRSRGGRRDPATASLRSKRRGRGTAAGARSRRSGPRGREAWRPALGQGGRRGRGTAAGAWPRRSGGAPVGEEEGRGDRRSAEEERAGRSGGGGAPVGEEERLGRKRDRGGKREQKKKVSLNGEPEFRVTIKNECSCPQADVKVLCDGVDTLEEIGLSKIRPLDDKDFPAVSATPKVEKKLS